MQSNSRFFLAQNQLARRTVLTTALMLPVAGACRRLAASSSPPLALRPPALRSPKYLKVTPDMVRDNKWIRLADPDQDWVLELPKDGYLPGGLFVHGLDAVRNLVIVGGGVRPEPICDPKTMKLNNGSDWSTYALRGFAGATGGTFRLSTCEDTYLPPSKPRWTEPLPWNARPEAIAAALEAAAGVGSVFAVDGPSLPGGPWKIVPTPGTAKLGRPKLDLSGLQGSLKPLQRNVFQFATTCGVTFRHWRGTIHMEGVDIGGDYLIDGINVQNPWGGAALQLANVHSAPRCHEFHDDWIHGDGAQFYLGPSVARFENVDLVSFGGNGFIAQPMDSKVPRPLDRLEDWTLRNCHFRTIADDRHPGANAKGGNACFRTAYPNVNQRWIVENVFCSRTRASDGALDTHAERERYYFYRGNDNAKLYLNQVPSSEFFADPKTGRCGPGYISPGYT